MNEKSIGGTTSCSLSPGAYFRLNPMRHARGSRPPTPGGTSHAAGVPFADSVRVQIPRINSFGASVSKLADLIRRIGTCSLDFCVGNGVSVQGSSSARSGVTWAVLHACCLRIAAVGLSILFVIQPYDKQSDAAAQGGSRREARLRRCRGGNGELVDFIATNIVRAWHESITDDWHLKDNLTFLQRIAVVAR
jgi:hypothetical protein